LLLRGGTVIDGSGAPRFLADVGVTGGVISFVGEAGRCEAREVLDVRGLVVAPGFIDSHAHDDRAVLADPGMQAKVSQGVTTVINGNCGNSLAPFRKGTVPPLPLRDVAPQYQFDSFAAYLDQLQAHPASVNVASLVGHTALRVCRVLDLDRPATEEEALAMRQDVRDALQAGALGLSTGTFYPPAAAATQAEIIAVGADLARHGGVYATHLRNEGDGVMEAIDESAAIAAALGVPLVVSHHKVMGAANFGRTVQTLDKLRLLSQTQKVCQDCYPYTASSSLLRLERLQQCDDIIITSSRTMPDCAGARLSELVARWNCTREEALGRVMPGTGMYFMMDEADVRRVLADPATIIGSDGISSDSYPHPRLWGTFARVLGHYSRELGLFPLEAAVRKMTGATAAAFGLQSRGELRVGYAADITVFDAGKVIDRATYLAPTEQALGIAHVIVNGTAVWASGAPTGARAGRCLRRAAGTEPAQDTVA
jgi:N-acyl-D-amino-acid deacylase